jgi:type IV pilus assembly protein PilV
MSSAATRRERRPAQRGSALVEVLVSVLLFSVGILGLLRVLEFSVRDSGEVEYRAEAAAIADETLGRMWVDRGNLASYATADVPVSELPNGRQTIVVAGEVVNITISWQPPGVPIAHAHTTSATLAVN